MGFLMILFWVALMVAVVVILVRLTNAARRGGGEDILKELRERYAKGEVGKKKEKEKPRKEE